MRRLLLAATILGASCSAQAADMPDFFGPLRGGYNEMSPSRVNWQGYYVGGQAQYGAMNSVISPTTINADLQATFMPPAGVAYNWKGLGAGNDHREGFGGFVGYNSQWDDVIVGIEANYMHGGFRSLTSSTGYTYGPSPDFIIASTTHSSALVQLSDFGSVRVRAGYAIDSYLPYLFAGVGFGYQTVDRNISATPAPVFTPDLMDSSSKSTLVYGYSAGFGIDVALMKGLFLRAEYEYQRVTSNVDSNIHSARVGIGYKF